MILDKKDREAIPKLIENRFLGVWEWMTHFSTYFTLRAKCHFRIPHKIAGNRRSRRVIVIVIVDNSTHFTSLLTPSSGQFPEEYLPGRGCSWWILVLLRISFIAWPNTTTKATLSLSTFTLMSWSSNPQFSINSLFHSPTQNFSILHQYLLVNVIKSSLNLMRWQLSAETHPRFHSHLPIIHCRRKGSSTAIWRYILPSFYLVL